MKLFADQRLTEAERAGAGIGEVAAVGEQCSASAQQVSASTQQTSASTQEIAASARELARTADELERLVGGASGPGHSLPVRAQASSDSPSAGASSS